MRTAILTACLLSLVGGVYAQRPGAGYCLGFNGSTDYITAPTLPEYQADTSFSVEAWILPYSISDNVIVGNNTFNLFGSPQGWSLRCQSPGTLQFQCSVGTFDAPNAVSPGYWQHVVVTVAPSGLRMYVDGREIYVNSPPGPINISPAPLHFARSPFNGMPAYFSGELDEIRIWDRALSQTDIRNWMCRKLTPAHPSYGALVGYWRIDDGMGNTVTDLSGYTNHGTLQAAPMWGWSGAHIGDTSMNDYALPIDMSMRSAVNDTFRVRNFGGNPQAVHLYRVDEAPNFFANPNGFSAMDTTHYWGVFIVGGNSPTYEAIYSWGNNPFFNGVSGCEAALAARSAGNFTQWGTTTGAPNLPTNRFVIPVAPAMQAIPARHSNPWGILALPAAQVCDGDTIHLTAATGAPAYQWYSGPSPIGGANTFTYSTTVAGTYTLQVTDGPCTYTSNAVTTSFVLPPVAGFGSPGGVCIDAGLDTLSTGTPVGGQYGGQGVSGNLFDPLAAGLGNHSLYYVFTDSIGCTDTAYANIAVHPVPTAIFPPLDSVCQLDPPVTLSGGLPVGGIYDGIGVSSGMFDPLLAGPGTFPLSYSVVDLNGCDDTAFSQITVLPAPITPSISVAGNMLVSSAAIGNQWYDVNGAIAGATGQTYTVMTTGTYYVIVTDSNGCSSDTSQIVMVTVGLAEGLELDVRIAPNPASSTAMVILGDAVDGSRIRLVGVTGQVWMEMEVGPGEQKIQLDLQAVPAGMYWLEVRGEGGSAVRKLIRQ